MRKFRGSIGQLNYSIDDGLVKYARAHSDCDRERLRPSRRFLFSVFIVLLWICTACTHFLSVVLIVEKQAGMMPGKEEAAREQVHVLYFPSNY